MPSSHRRYADWTIDRIRREADGLGPSVSILCALILERRPHPAAARAIEIGALTYGSVKSILDNKLDRLAADPLQPEHQPLRNRNLRGGRGHFH
jgi:hypothetical protein